MSTFIQKRYIDVHIKKLMKSDPAYCRANDPISVVTDAFKGGAVGALLVNNDVDELVGIVTEDDVTNKVILSKEVTLSDPVAKIMTPEPETLRANASVARAIYFYAKGKYRHLPIVHAKSFADGILSVRDIVSYIFQSTTHAKLDPEESATAKILTTPLHSLSIPMPLFFDEDAPLKDVVKELSSSMRKAVLTRSNEKQLSGIFTERDIVTKFPDGGKSYLEQPIAQFVTREPQTVAESETLLSAFELMSARGIRHIPVVDRDDKVTGILSVHELMNIVGDAIVKDIEVAQ